MNRNIFIVLGVVAVLLAGGLVLNIGPAEAPEPAEEPEWPEYTLEEVAQHSTEEDCWQALDGMVLEISPNFISAHPGGRENILRGCGKNISEMFRNRPTDPSTEHSQTAFDLAKSFQIGVVAK